MLDLIGNFAHAFFAAEIQDGVSKTMRPLSPVRHSALIVLIATIAITTLCAPAHGETLTLEQAIQRALAFAPTVGSANAQSDLSTAMVREARAPLYPSLSAGSEYMQAPGYSIAVTNGGLSDAMLTLNYTAYDFGRRLAQARAALYQSEADRYGIRAARAQIIFDTTVAYYDVVRAQEIEREFITDDARLKRYVAVVKALRTSGRSIANDVLKVQTASNSAGLSLSSAHHEVERTTAVLGADCQSASSDRRISPSPRSAACPRGRARTSRAIRCSRPRKEPSPQPRPPCRRPSASAIRP